MSDFYMGVDIGGTKIAFGLYDEKRKCVRKDVIASDDRKSGEIFFTDVADYVIAYAKEAQILGGHLKSVGIGVPGFVEFKTGKLSKVPSLPGISGFAAGDFLKARLARETVTVNTRVILDNDGHCGALAEYRQGAGRGHESMIYALVSTGISTAMVLDRRLFRGSNGASGESGHMVTCVHDSLAHDCMCGNRGCFNSLGSGKAILNYVREWIDAGEETLLTSMVDGPAELTARHLNEAYEKGDPLAIRAIEQMAKYLSAWIFDVYMLLNVDCIVFAGGLLAMGDKLMGRIREGFEYYHTNGFPVHFYETELGSDTCLIGAMELGRDE